MRSGRLLYPAVGVSVSNGEIFILRSKLRSSGLRFYIRVFVEVLLIIGFVNIDSKSSCMYPQDQMTMDPVKSLFLLLLPTVIPV